MIWSFNFGGVVNKVGMRAQLDRHDINNSCLDSQYEQNILTKIIKLLLNAFLYSIHIINKQHAGYPYTRNRSCRNEHEIVSQGD
jgi:hypothetical protein